MSGVDERLRALLEESGITDEGSDGLAALLASLETGYVDDATPEPGPDLAALLSSEGGALTTGTPSPRRGHRAAVTGLTALGVVLGTGWAAAANELPAPAQHWVADFSQRFLPFDLPYPESGTPGHPEPPGDDQTRQWPDEHDAPPTPAGDSGEDGVSTSPTAHQDESPEMAEGNSEGEADEEESSETALGDEREEVQDREDDAESTPDKSRETSGTQEIDNDQASESEGEPDAPRGEAPEESVDD